MGVKFEKRPLIILYVLPLLIKQNTNAHEVSYVNYKQAKYTMD